MIELLVVLDELEVDLREARARCDERDREGGTPRAQFLDELDDYLPELGELCKRRWMLELLVRLCRMRGER